MDSAPIKGEWSPSAVGGTSERFAVDLTGDEARLARRQEHEQRRDLDRLRGAPERAALGGCGIDQRADERCARDRPGRHQPRTGCAGDGGIRESERRAVIRSRARDLCISRLCGEAVPLTAVPVGANGDLPAWWRALEGDLEAFVLKEALRCDPELSTLGAEHRGRTDQRCRTRRVSNVLAASHVTPVRGPIPRAHVTSLARRNSGVSPDSVWRRFRRAYA